MTQIEQTKNAKNFAEYWKDKGDEKQDTQRYWIELLQEVLGIENPARYIEFEKRVKLSHTSFIDAYISGTKVLIEQKGIKIDLAKPQNQSDGAVLTPFGQAKRYADELPYDLRPRWIVVSNFAEIHIHDMNNPHAEPEIVKIANLEKEYYRLSFLAEQENIHIKREMEVSIKAGEIVGLIYDKLLAQYKLAKNVDMEKCLKSLNMLCVRLVFCMYAEDAGIFGHKSMFGDYLNHFEAKDLRSALINLFKVLDQKPENRDPFLEDELAAFPYVNGGLFTEEDQFIPPFTDEIKDLLVKKASDDFDWSEISPTIFGAVFESTLNPETRRTGGMHYTSIENIHKVIDPLFLNELKEEFENIKELKQEKTRETKLIDFQKKLGSLKFLDPACGSGNFLTETYLSLRRLENEILKQLFKGGQMLIGFHDDWKPIEVSIEQFYGIEINDFASVVAKTALWIAESQMMKETEKLVEKQLNFLPLKSYANIVEGNALRIDWETVVPKNELNYIMGNPPFVGSKYSTPKQKEDMDFVFAEIKTNYRTLDYVSCWYVKVAKMIENTNIKCALVSTNSITQGEQVEILWKPLFERYKIKFDFVWKTFQWDSEANIKAHVHCIILGFSHEIVKTKKIIYLNDKQKVIANNINGYLIDAPNIFIESRNKSLCKVLPMVAPNKPCDYNHLKIEPEEYEVFKNKEPNSLKWIKKMVGAQEFIKNKERYCLWLVNCSPKELRTMPLVLDRVEKCKQARLEANTSESLKLAERPTLFREQLNPENYLLIPCVSSENRRYVPIGFLHEDTIPVMGTLIIPNATLYEFGILTSNVHNAWMRAVCGRLKSDYRYSKDIVYNNFPWCTPTDEQKAKIEQTAQAILDTRAKYPECSLADLYDETVMPPELRKAHQENDKAVMSAYGFNIKMTESECVAELFKMYEKLTARK